MNVWPEDRDLDPHRGQDRRPQPEARFHRHQPSVGQQSEQEKIAWLINEAQVLDWPTCVNEKTNIVLKHDSRMSYFFTILKSSIAVQVNETWKSKVECLTRRRRSRLAKQSQHFVQLPAEGAATTAPWPRLRQQWKRCRRPQKRTRPFLRKDPGFLRHGAAGPRGLGRERSREDLRPRSE